MNINLKRFCASTDDDRACLREPWPHKGWMYATNGHIIVRVPAPDHAGTVAEHDIAERAVGIFAKCEADGHAPLPRLALGQKCNVCRGTGHVYTVKCGECDDGEFQHGSHTYECKECEGTGRAESTKAGGGEKTTCIGCHGKGYCGFNRVPIGDKGAGYDAVYLSWIRALPNAVFAPGEAEKTAHFKFDGGEGCLMPMWDH